MSCFPLCGRLRADKSQAHVPKSKAVGRFLSTSFFLCPRVGHGAEKGGGEGRRGRDVCGCVVGGELAGEKGHLQATSSECHLLGLVVVLKGPLERLIDSRLDAACHIPALVFAH